MVYGLFAVDLTLPTILQAQKIIFGMYRKMIGDFGQHTKHTHAFVIAANHLDHPISLLIASATRLAQTLGHRLNQLHPDDILLHVDWSHLPTTIQLLHAALALPSQAQTIDHVMAEAEPLWHAC